MDRVSTPAPGHRLARRLLGLPHVFSRSGRAADRSRRPSPIMCYSPIIDVKEFPDDVDHHAGRRRSRQRRSSARQSAWSAGAPGFWSRSAIAPSPAMSPHCAISFRSRTCSTAPTGNPRHRRGSARGKRHCSAACSTACCASMMLYQWIIFCPGCPPSADAIFTLRRRSAGGPHAGRRRKEVRIVSKTAFDSAGDADRGPRQNFDSTRTMRAKWNRRAFTLPSFAASRSCAKAVPFDGNARTHVARLRHLSGEPRPRQFQSRRHASRR